MRLRLCEECITVLIFKNEFVFAAVEVENGGLLSLEHQVVIVDKLVFGEAGDEVSFAYALFALDVEWVTTNM